MKAIQGLKAETLLPGCAAVAASTIGLHTSRSRARRVPASRMSAPEYLDREKTFEVALADDDAGAGFAEVKMAPVETATRSPATRS